jgi:hypothetical protein
VARPSGRERKKEFLKIGLATKKKELKIKFLIKH